MLSLLPVSWQQLFINNLRREWYDKWSLKCDEDIDMELRFHLAEKSESFNVRTDITVLRAIADAHEFKGKPGTAVDMMHFQDEKDQCDREELSLLIKNGELDMKALAQWQKRCEQTIANAYATAQQDRLKVEDLALCAAVAYMGKKMLFFTEDVSEETGGKTINALLDFRRDKPAKATAASDPSQIPIIGSLNWAAPSVFNEKLKKVQLQVLSFVMADGLRNIVLMQMPVHTNMKGKLYLSEQNVQDRLVRSNALFDTSYGIMFKEKVDARDERPMLYPCRMLFPAAIVDLSKSIWWTSKLRLENICGPVQQVAPKNMSQVEDLADEALPHQTGDHYVSGAAKWMQLGPEAHTAQILSLLESPSAVGVPAAMILSLSPDVGDDAKSFVDLTMQLNTPLYYFALCESQIQAGWLEETLKEHIKELVKQNKLIVPGHVVKLETDVSKEEKFADMPEMRVLIPKGKVATKPANPEPGAVLPKELFF